MKTPSTLQEIAEFRRKEMQMIFSVGPERNAPRSHYRIDRNTDNKYVKHTVRALTGKYVVVAERDEFYGGLASQPYISGVLTDPTWGQLFRCAKEAQRKTLDIHHAYFEGVRVTKRKMTVDGIECAVLDLSLGS